MLLTNANETQPPGADNQSTAEVSMQSRSFIHTLTAACRK